MIPFRVGTFLNIPTKSLTYLFEWCKGSIWLMLFHWKKSAKGGRRGLCSFITKYCRRITSGKTTAMVFLLKTLNFRLTLENWSFKLSYAFYSPNSLNLLESYYSYLILSTTIDTATVSNTLAFFLMILSCSAHMVWVSEPIHISAMFYVIYNWETNLWNN